MEIIIKTDTSEVAEMIIKLLKRDKAKNDSMGFVGGNTVIRPN